MADTKRGAATPASIEKKEAFADKLAVAEVSNGLVEGLFTLVFSLLLGGD